MNYLISRARVAAGTAWGVDDQLEVRKILRECADALQQLEQNHLRTEIYRERAEQAEALLAGESSACCYHRAIGPTGTMLCVLPSAHKGGFHGAEGFRWDDSGAIRRVRVDVLAASAAFRAKNPKDDPCE